MKLKHRITPKHAALAAIFVSLSLTAASARGDDALLDSYRVDCRKALDTKDQWAVAKCRRAFLRGGDAQDLRNASVAVVDGKSPPQFADLVDAVVKADIAVKLHPKEPWGYSARCHIAARIGDPDMLETCLADARRVAPAHEETKALLAFTSPRESALVWLGRVLVALMFAGTLAHALARRARLRRKSEARAAAAPLVSLVALVCLSVISSRPAWSAPLQPPGDQLSEFKIDPANPVASVPDANAQNSKPIEFGYFLQDMLVEAERAVKRGDHEAAAKYYLGLMKAVPDRAYAYGKACEQFEILNDRRRALETCRVAVTQGDPSVADFDRLVRLIAHKGQPLTADDRKELGEIEAHLGSIKDGGIGPAYVHCQVALALEDKAGLKTCTAALHTVAPNDPRTISFEWALAIQNRDHAGADALIERAKKAGVSPEGIATMERTTRNIGAFRFIRPALWGLGGTALLLLLFRRQLFQRRRVEKEAVAASPAA
jgi:hypothetical protein